MVVPSVAASRAIFAARADAISNENCATTLAICGAASHINPRRRQRAHVSPGEKLQRTLDALQALQTRAGGGMHDQGGGKKHPRHLVKSVDHRRPPSEGDASDFVILM